jgi:phenylalanyl-tRNA synthetase beta chain
LIRVAQQNLSRQRNRCRLFETGTVFSGDSDSIWEGTAVAGIAIGTLEPEHWDGTGRDVDYFDLKADVAALVATTGNSASLSFRACEHPALNPASATAIMLDEVCIGYLGALHPHFERVFDIRKGAILFELDVEKAFNAKVGAYRPFSRFPHVRRDIAVVVDEAINAGELTKLVAETLGDKLQRTIVFDEYRGKALETGRKSIGLGLILQDAYRTLTDADADQLLADAIRRLEHELGAKIRT